MLKFLICLPLIGLIINNLVYLTKKNETITKKLNFFSMFFSILVFYVSFWIFLIWNNFSNEFQFRDILDFYFIQISIGIDGISISIILIITLIFPILMLLINKEINKNETTKDIINILFFMQFILIFIFISLDIFIFFILFEIILIPMFLLIGKYGSRTNKIEAAFRFFLYTLIGSLFMLISILILYLKFGTTNLEILNFKLLTLYSSQFSFLLKFIWILIFFSFLIKLPMFPFHTWLPEAHTEAPTIGSILLAAILLKLGSYGIYKFSFILFFFDSFSFLDLIQFFLPVFFILSFLSIYLCSFIAISTIDLKKIIAYSSIVHMNFSIFGFFSFDLSGLLGSNFLMFSHAFVSSALFLLIGILYKRYHTRILFYFKGFVLTMPLFSFFFLFFSLANISLPFTSSFIAEIFILISSFKSNFFLSFLLTFSLIFSCSYVFFFTNRILFSLLPSPKLLHLFLDLSLLEFFALLPMLLITLILGFFPKPLFDLFKIYLINISS